MTRAVRILLADDHIVVRTSLALLLEEEPDLQIVGQAGDGREAVALAERLRPDVVVMDLNMPVVDGVEATRQITACCPEVKVIGLSFHEAAYVAHALLKAGGAAYVVKNAPAGELVAAIRAVR